MENSALPWATVKFKADHDDDGQPYISDEWVEISFTHNNRNVGVVVWAPSDTPCAALKGRLIPCGWLVGKCEGEVVAGPLDQATWDKITKMIAKEGLCPN
jgi:hypothetical protein